MVSIGSSVPQRRPAHIELTEQRPQGRQREADYGVGVSDHRGDEWRTEAVYRKGAGYLERFAGRDVGIDLVVGDVGGEGDSGRRDVADCATNGATRATSGRCGLP